MRKILLFSLSLILFGLFVSCSDKDDSFYVSVSGEGSIVVDSGSPSYLYRMVLFSYSTEQEVYFMGSTAYVNGDAEFVGRGVIVKMVLPNQTDNSVLLAQSFDIGSSDSYEVSYSPYVSFSSSGDNEDYVTLDSGTVIIRRSGEYLDVRMLGVDADDNKIIMSYSGYTYRSFNYSDDDDLRSM